VLLNHHWHLLVFDWKDFELWVYDSLVMTSVTHPHLLKFAGMLLGFIMEDFHLGDQDWAIIPEQVHSLHNGMIPVLMIILSTVVINRIVLIVGCIYYGTFTAFHIMVHSFCNL
jgi:hypothetical protein